MPCKTSTLLKATLNYKGGLETRMHPEATLIICRFKRAVSDGEYNRARLEER